MPPDLQKIVDQAASVNFLDKATAMVVAAISGVAWFDTAVFHFKSGQHILLCLDVLCPPFGVVLGLLRFVGLV